MAGRARTADAAGRRGPSALAGLAEPTLLAATVPGAPQPPAAPRRRAVRGTERAARAPAPAAPASRSTRCSTPPGRRARRSRPVGRTSCSAPPSPDAHRRSRASTRWSACSSTPSPSGRRCARTSRVADLLRRTQSERLALIPYDYLGLAVHPAGVRAPAAVRHAVRAAELRRREAGVGAQRRARHQRRRQHRPHALPAHPGRDTGREREVKFEYHPEQVSRARVERMLVAVPRPCSSSGRTDLSGVGRRDSPVPQRRAAARTQPRPARRAPSPTCSPTRRRRPTRTRRRWCSATAP